MREDPEYRRLVYKHGPHQQAGEIEIMIEEQRAENKNSMLIVINVLERRQRLNKGIFGEQLTHTMFRNLSLKMEVAAVYCPPRIATMVERMGLRAGWALDLTTCDEDGREWNFDHLEMRNRVVRKLLKDKPSLLVGSPMCTAFSQMNENVNYTRMDPEEIRRRKAYGRKHLELCAKFYDMQWSAGRYFIYEHLAGASSWKEPCIVELMGKHGVDRVNGDQCCYGLKSTENGVT